MKAEPLSSRPYYPYLLSNGNDVVLIGLSGSMNCGACGHIHAEQNQGTVCSWLKTEHRKKGVRTAPVISSGYTAVLNGEVCTPKWYEQEFDPQRGILYSKVAFCFGTEIGVTTFLTSSGILVHELEVLKSNAETFAVDFYLVVVNCFNTATPLCEVPETAFEASCEGVDGTYHFKKNGPKGRCLLRTDRKDGTPIPHWDIPKLHFENVTPGWRGVMYVICKDESEDIPVISDSLKADHEKEHLTYFNTSKVVLPDPEIQYSWDVGRYMMRAAQHKKGGIVCGLLPHMWEGGTCCPCDAERVFLAMLQTNNVAEARKHLQYYIDQYEEGVKICKELGIKGVAFSNWGNVLGEHCSGRDLEYELLHRKPIMIAIIGIAAGEYLSYADPEDADVKKLLHGCAGFISSFVQDDGTIRPCVASNESYVTVERDTTMLSVTIRCLEMDAQFNGEKEFLKVTQKLRKELEKNRDERGVILPWAEAKYDTCMPVFSQNYLPGIHNAEQLAIYHKNAETPWGGIVGEQPSESPRDWPWSGPRLAREYAREGAAEKAFPLLKNWFRHAASSGAVPEFIRLDGYPIGYWYPTPYAYFLEAMAEAFGRMEGNTLYLLPGFDGEWKDLQAENLRLEGGFLLSCKVVGGRVTEFMLAGGSGKENIEVVLNPAYGSLSKSIFAPCEKEYHYTADKI